MKTAQLLEEIREANLSYLMLAQRMLREDREEGLFRLGLSPDVGDIVRDLSPAQMLKVAASNMLLARFRFSEQLVWNLVAGHSRDAKIGAMHASVLMAGAPAEVAL
jgi:flagellar transcriptional activator FlhD